MNAFVQILRQTYSVMKLYLCETPIQERMKIETTAAISLFHGWNQSSRPFSSKTNDKLSEIVGFVRENLNILTM